MLTTEIVIAIDREKYIYNYLVKIKIKVKCVVLYT